MEKSVNRQQLEQYSQNPNVQKMLNLIASTEGVKHGYNTLFGNQRINSLNAHPNMRKAFKQTDGRTNYTTAAGRYQFINPTWIKLAQQYGFKDFSAKNQDLGAIALIAQRGALNDVTNGNYKSAIGKLGKEWASLPTSTYAQGKRSWDFVNKQLGQDVGKNVGGGIETNRFLSQEQIAKVLPNFRKQTNQVQPSRFLSQEQISKVLPQISQTSQQPNRFLSQEQIAKVLPQLNKGAQNGG